MLEIELQKIIHSIISEPSIVRKTESDKRLQILSPGQLNVFPGPDFNDMAILLDGLVVVGDAEFHKKSSDWILHNHSSDPAYDNVIIHIVIDNDICIDRNFETLVISEDELNFANSNQFEQKNSDESSLEEIQHFALIRLLRKSAEAQRLLNKFGLYHSLVMLVQSYLERYTIRRKRPVYSQEKLLDISSNLKNSLMYQFLLDIESGVEISVQDKFLELMKKKLSGEGSHIRREILLNCVLPIAICIAPETSRIALFLWYWSTPALNTYGILKRRFTNIPQNYLWEQQGMLEYLKEYGRKPNIVRDVVNSYGFAEILSFYRIGNSVYEQNSDD